MLTRSADQQLLLLSLEVKLLKTWTLLLPPQVVPTIEIELYSIAEVPVPNSQPFPSILNPKRHSKAKASYSCKHFNKRKTNDQEMKKQDLNVNYMLSHESTTLRKTISLRCLIQQKFHRLNKFGQPLLAILIKFPITKTLNQRLL